jgi:hypothetical protein
MVCITIALEHERHAFVRNDEPSYAHWSPNLRAGERRTVAAKFLNWVVPSRPFRLHRRIGLRPD